VILQHPALCHGIINEDKPDPAFVLVDSVNLDLCIEWVAASGGSAEEHEKKLKERLEKAHSERFKDVDRCPPWKLIVMMREEGRSFDAVFAFHHALGDGLSGMVFHRAFAEALNDDIDDDEEPNLKIKIPKQMKMNPPVEKMIDFKLSWSFFLTQIWQSVKPSWWFPTSERPWTGPPISKTNLENYQSRVEWFSIPVNQVKAILAECRRNDTTLTGLLHALTILSFSTHVPEAKSFTSTTPYSLRHLSGLSPTDDFAVQVSAFNALYNTQIISELHTLKDPSTLTAKLWNLAQRFKKDMNLELSRLPHDNMLGLIPYISDMHAFYTKKIGDDRDSTYEISNVGVLKVKSLVSVDGWTVERVIFSQSGMGTGAGLGINVASVAGGELVVCFTWVKGDVEEGLVEKVRRDLRFGLGCVGEGKDVEVRS
jgi:hypothetical protein